MTIAKIIERLGGFEAVGRLCGVTRQAVYQWERVPARFVLRLAKASDITPHQMRPDCYPHPLDGRRGKRKRNGKRGR